MIAAEKILSMTLDAKHTDGSIFYLAGGLANQGTTSDEAFLYSFLDGNDLCEIRHSMRIATMDLGIQGVSIADTVIWAIALSSGRPSVGIYDTTNVIIRANKDDPSIDPEFYRVDMKGTEAGSIGAR